MASYRWLFLVLSGIAVASACGGRTGDLDDDDDGFGGAIGNGGGTGISGSTGVGGRGNGGKTGVGGRANGGAISVGGSYGGYGGYIGVGGGVGGIGAGGGPATCSYPSCNGCGTCYDSCLCQFGNVGGASGNVCWNQCGGGGAGGVSGTGGVPANGGAPDACSDGCSVGDVRSADWEFKSCCQPSGTCGLQGYNGVLGGDGVCFAPLGGVYDSDCPSALFAAGPAAGCCRADGTCGLDMGTPLLGCVQLVTSNGPVKCDGISPGTGGAGGGPSTGGRTSAGGTTSTGGRVGTGGITAAGGLPSTGGRTGAGGVVSGGSTSSGGGPNAEQCAASATSSCEACACKGCFDSLLPCYKDEGCPFILQCTVQTGCKGIDCLSPSVCGSVIDKYGGLGSTSGNLAVNLFACMSGSGCGCGFGGL